MPLLMDQYTGLGRITRELYLIFFNQYNDALTEQENYWTQLDIDEAAATGKVYDPVVLERVQPQFFYKGHRPSLLNATPDMYPNVCTMAYTSGPGGDQQLDHIHGISDMVYIEIMCKSGPYAITDVEGLGEELVNNRITRMVDAAHSVLMKNRRLNGLVSDIPLPPSVDISNVFVVQDENNRWYFQGARLDYAVLKLARAY